MKQKEVEKKNRLNVLIYDEEYTVRGSADQQYIQKVAALVDRKMKQISNTNSFLSTKQLAVLVALNMADEMLHLQEDYDELVKILNGLHKNNKKRNKL